ncbi:MAG: hypothetical protein N3E46_06820 [Gemmataceae bacterium]|uniref:Uncharacterized protein n=1 Tax=Thermogemmata fonticola TaxID=2755323 RepID=A0A7V8VHD0_9BACT|nr:hypothetical protein [Thermogemmata fonticola]MBA2227957.1 hypothetical protein [Thermogemmata fonticola]MCX8139379.1 hypothetical protein [Gemmataceae bacterium]
MTRPPQSNFQANAATEPPHCIASLAAAPKRRADFILSGLASFFHPLLWDWSATEGRAVPPALPKVLQ